MEYLDTSLIDDTNPEDNAHERERAELLVSAIQAGKTLDRNILTAFYQEGKSIRQIANDWNIPEGTVKRRLHVARRRLGVNLRRLGF